MVRLDLYNAYARLGVSPLMTTEEIKATALRKRKEILGKRKQRVIVLQEFGEEEAEMAELQQLESQIGVPKARAQYDQANPQNELLTVQPSPYDRMLDPRHRSSLITAWLIEELGRDSLLPSPDCLALWTPGPPNPDLEAFLQAFVTESSATIDHPLAERPGTGDGEAQLPGVEDLIRLAQAPRDGDGTSGPEGRDGAEEGMGDG
jgi:hypothetical protein